MKKKSYSLEQKIELKKFSYALVLLKTVPAMLMLTIILVLALKFKFITLNQGLSAMLITLVLVYFLLPTMAARVLEGIMAMRKTTR